MKFLFLDVCTAPWLLHGLQNCRKGVVEASLWLTAAKLAVKFELVRLNGFAALAVVCVKPDADVLSRVVLVIIKAHFYCRLGRPKELNEAGCAAQLEFVVFKRDFFRGLENVQATTASKQ